MSLFATAALDVLFVLASGYALYSVRLVQLTIGRGAGYRLYFQVLMVGLVCVGLAAWFGGSADEQERSNAGFMPLFFVSLAAKIAVDGLTALVLLCSDELKYQFNRRVFHLSDLATEVFLLDAVRSSEMVLVTLENGEIYAGIVVDFIPPATNAGLKSFYLRPALSGYRAKETRAIKLTTHYPPVKPGEKKKFHVLLFIDKINHIQLFDVEFYDEHFAGEPAGKSVD